MILHHYHPDTGLPLGTSTADESPLEPGAYLIPAHATELPPPPCADGERIVWIGAAWRVEAIPPAPVPPAPTLDDMRAAKRAEIESAYRQSIAPVTDGYTQEERDSWGKQETEARNRLISEPWPTPLLTAIAIERGMEVIDLAALVATKADEYAAIAGAAFGRRRARLTDLAAAATPEAVAAITW